MVSGIALEKFVSFSGKQGKIEMNIKKRSGRMPGTDCDIRVSY
jgi:hypothetical protein